VPRIVAFIATSLDGYIAGPGGDLDWLFTDADHGYERFYASVDRVIMGRRTYETVLGFGWPYAGKRSFVFTHRPIAPRDDVVAVVGEPADVAPRIAEGAAGDLWLVGGGDLIGQFRRARLVDRYVLSVHPVLLGRGTPLFPGELPREQLELTAQQSWPNGLVQLTYERVVHRAW
jgi:dihydrofolate reductase